MLLKFIFCLIKYCSKNYILQSYKSFLQSTLMFETSSDTFGNCMNTAAPLPSLPDPFCLSGTMFLGGIFRVHKYFIEILILNIGLRCDREAGYNCGVASSIHMSLLQFWITILYKRLLRTKAHTPLLSCKNVIVKAVQNCIVLCMFYVESHSNI